MLSLPHPLIVLSAQVNETPPQKADCFASWEDFLQSGSEARGFFINDFTGKNLGALIRAIRRSRWWAVPVIGWKDAPPDDFFLLDALLPLDEAKTFTAEMAARHKLMPGNSGTMELCEKILYFLYIRQPNATLKPFLDRNDFHLYRYPVVECLATKKEDVRPVIDRLFHYGLLERVALLDRTQHCPACSSAHMHMLQVCPSCGSIDIHHAETKDPACTCASCHHSFSRGIVRVRCLDCGQDYLPNDLISHDICTLALSPRGQVAAQARQIEKSFAAFDNERYVDPAFFRQIFHRMLNTREQFKDFYFSLLHINFVNAEALMDRLGGQRLYILLNELAHGLLGILRTSDFITRIQAQHLCLLFPLAPSEGMAARLTAFFEHAQAEHKIEEQLEIEISAIDITSDTFFEAGVDADSLINSLIRREAIPLLAERSKPSTQISEDNI